ncbi:uncharacterized protein TRAVEDRAFT_58059 [Trametes versicolor FP-101664 SS1]|uniref:uncharacterized protein n=1 Tax=Trametes versicolor (strain FP-101664) TaxID=717944 RepID=UPI00046234F9|nr:uncharacterized protein TRAVEDRAFT_58059 [Trametes versicolor FP-101664 SS1]EIW59054.1 hypothetical protein TRAVEDRAFT_58059 [Trametes versicolor FP-101664 SS1]
MGLPIPRDDAAAIEQVRSMLSIKQQQKELIEQRRGSTAGLAPPVSAPPAPPAHPHQAPSDERQPSAKAHAPARTGGRSPITSGPRRSSVALSANAPSNRGVSPLARQSSPPPPHHSQHGPAPPMLHPPPPHISMQEQHTGGSHQHALPAPPISFARRRATRQLGKSKPADIMISPRDAAGDRLQPSIQSAPPIPRAGATQGMTGRFGNMMLPSLPPVLGPGQSTQRMTASRVPPTPTRLSMARHPPTASILTPTVGSISTTAAAAAARSPPTATVPIATTLVPPTPAALHAPGYAGEKAAFLAPFEMFYDALADARTLKGWLGEQLQKSQALATQLQRQQEHLDEVVAAAVERHMTPVRNEMFGLQRRVDELEHALHHVASGSAATSGLVRTTSTGHGHGQTYSPNMGAAKGKTKANGVPESYQFPPSAGDGPGAVVRRALSPAQLERERESRSFPGSQTGSPVPFDVGRRLSVSAIRLDPRAPVVSDPTPVHRTPGRERERELGGRALPPPPSAAPVSGAGGSGGSWNRPWSPRSARVSLPAGTSATRSSLGHHERPGLPRRASAQRVAGEGYAYVGHEGAEGRDRDRDRDGEGDASSPPPPPPRNPPRRDARSPEPMEE